ncbi:MAG TPA: hypothetical protein PLW83_09745 [Deltaproteobacteria bacterium]|nr:hypothetical protein [Deltaproteobacteria bacterium]
MDDYEAEAKKILIKKKHELHEETLMRIIQELQDLLVKHEKYAGPESIFAFARASAEALLFLCQERKRDRDKRKGDFKKPAQELPPSGSDLL